MIGLLSFAQAQEKKMNMADFEKKKQEYVRQKAGLSTEEAQRYFPLNSELTQKKFELNRQHREKVDQMRRNKNMSDEEYRQILENDVDVKVKEAELDKEYSNKFDKALSPEKLFRAQQAEKRFMQQEVTRFRQENPRGRGSEMRSNNNNRGGRTPGLMQSNTQSRSSNTRSNTTRSVRNSGRR